MSETTQKEKIKLDIQPGPISPAMRHAWVTFWKRLIALAKSEAAK